MCEPSALINTVYPIRYQYMYSYAMKTIDVNAISLKEAKYARDY